MYENNRLLMLSRSQAHPRGIGNRRGQLGGDYMAHSYLTVNGLFAAKPNCSAPGAVFTALDDWDADNFDHARLGFINGATLSHGEQADRAGAHDAAGRAAVGLGQGVAEGQRELGRQRAFAQVPCMPYEANMLDLDPTAKDQHGRPRIRITFQLGENEERMGAFLRQKPEAWLRGGATRPGAGRRSRRSATSGRLRRHAHGQRPGRESRPKLVVHGVPNLFVLGGSTFRARP